LQGHRTKLKRKEKQNETKNKVFEIVNVE